MIRRKRPRKHGDRWSEMRGVDGVSVPSLVPKQKGKKYREPEEILQDDTNRFLDLANQFYFRIPASVYQKAHDSSIRGWPDNPMITKLIPGLAALGPLELKKEGEKLSAGQVEMQAAIGTVWADNWPSVEAYVKWYWKAIERLRAFAKTLLPPPVDAEGKLERPQSDWSTSPRPQAPEPPATGTPTPSN